MKLLLLFVPCLVASVDPALQFADAGLIRRAVLLLVSAVADTGFGVGDFRRGPDRKELGCSTMSTSPRQASSFSFLRW